MVPLQHPMHFDDRFLSDLKARCRPSEVIGRTVKLRRQGREFVGLSPFTQEKSPSFTVNDEKGFFHDFSSGKHGDVIAFLQEAERLTFPEAVARLAEQVGMPLPEPTPAAARRRQRLASLQGWLERAATWYQGQLEAPGGAAARAYLAQRGVPVEQQRRYRLGYAPPGRTGLRDHLAAAGASAADLVQCGLVIDGAKSGGGNDRFRDRLMFPILDDRGQVLSFAGRTLAPGGRAKYLNGPETRLFAKSRTLYGLGEARGRLRGAGEARADLIAVEGYLDVLACDRAGVAAVSAMGATLSEAQLHGLWRLHPEPVIAMDADAAGLRATGRIVERALPLVTADHSLRFAALAGKDPDAVLRDEGAEALRRQLAQARPFVDALFEVEAVREPAATPEARARLRRRLRTALAALTDPDLAQAYREALRVRLADHAPGRVPGFVAALAVAALDRPEWAAPYPVRLGRLGFGDARLAPAATAVAGARSGGRPPRDVLAQAHPDLLGELDAAAAAVEAPFLDPRLDPERARSLWRASYDALAALWDDAPWPWTDVPSA